ncbi:hypothetical protein ACFL35_12690 [Candidatus Riflebacteria bacterium]
MKELEYTSSYCDGKEFKSYNFHTDENIVRWIIEQERILPLKKRLTTALAPKILEYFSIQYVQEKDAFMQFIQPGVTKPLSTDFFVGAMCRPKHVMEFTHSIIIEHIFSNFMTQNILAIPLGIYWYLCQVPEFQERMIDALKKFSAGEIEEEVE